jgi:hypothetical protein
MPVKRIPISRAMFCELLGIDPSRFIGMDRERCEREGQPCSTGLLIMVEPEEPDANDRFLSAAE